MVNITDNLCIKQGNPSKKSAVYHQERVIMELGQYLNQTFADLEGNRTSSFLDIIYKFRSLWQSVSVYYSKVVAIARSIMVPHSGT